MSDDKIRLVPGLYVNGAHKRKRKKIPIKNAEGKITGWKWSDRDIQLVTAMNIKSGEIYKFRQDVTGNYGDQNHTEHIPSKFIKRGAPGRNRAPKKKKTLHKGNVCHRLSSYPGCEAGYNKLLRWEKGRVDIVSGCHVVTREMKRLGRNLDQINKAIFGSPTVLAFFDEFHEYTTGGIREQIIEKMKHAIKSEFNRS